MNPTGGTWRFDPRGFVVSVEPPTGRPFDPAEYDAYGGGYVIAETVTAENGPLLAAAPDLLAALERLIKTNGADYEGGWQAGKRAIAKARGKAF